jgi:hypothetical protein
VECLVNTLQAEVRREIQHELSWARGAVDLRATRLGVGSLPELPPRDLTQEEQEAARLIPVRQARGPIPFENHLRRLDGGARERWRQLGKARQGMAHDTLTTLALYWADGARSVLEIADLVELESGQRDVELLLAYFRMLEQLGFVRSLETA